MNKNRISVVPFESDATESARGSVDSTWQRVIQRRKFLQGVGLAGTAAGASTLFAQTGSRLSSGDVALIRLAAAIELIEADLWQQYNELGGAVDHNDQPNPGNPAAES